MYKVVIVDDEPVIRAGLRELLPWEELGMQIVFEAENGAAALDYLHTHRVEILITDIRMEVMDGLELIRQAKALYPQLHCVILTGFDDLPIPRPPYGSASRTIFSSPWMKRNCWRPLPALKTS